MHGAEHHSNEPVKQTEAMRASFSVHTSEAHAGPNTSTLWDSSSGSHVECGRMQQQHLVVGAVKRSLPLHVLLVL